MISRLLLLANGLGLGIYVLCQGIERFWWESFGTWVISPIIYIRLCPPPFQYWMVDAVNAQPLLGNLLCGVPVVMASTSLVLGVLAYRRRSLPFAVASCVLMTTIFVVYHSVKHMGMHFQTI